MRGNSSPKTLFQADFLALHC